MILALICAIAVGVRVFSVIRYESVIHEFDPWFNFRGSEILEKKGWYAFKYWID
jgi:dolichyl-diphosphooligosaccharide--protein glycosyltransferase